MSIRILLTGGTFDKEYDERTGTHMADGYARVSGSPLTDYWTQTFGVR